MPFDVIIEKHGAPRPILVSLGSIKIHRQPGPSVSINPFTPENDGAITPFGADVLIPIRRLKGTDEIWCSKNAIDFSIRPRSDPVEIIRQVVSTIELAFAKYYPHLNGRAIPLKPCFGYKPTREGYRPAWDHDPLPLLLDDPAVGAQLRTYMW